MTDQTAAEDRLLDWEDEIENESGGVDFITLPAGTEADFVVVGFSRERHTPSVGGKLPACNKAVVELHFDGFAEGQTINENLFLHSKTEGILCSFFTAIGQRQHGQRMKMDWGEVVGAKGRARLAVREYEKDGETRTINQVKKYLDPEQGEKTAAYTPGAF